MRTTTRRCRPTKRPNLLNYRWKENLKTAKGGSARQIWLRSGDPIQPKTGPTWAGPLGSKEPNLGLTCPHRVSASFGRIWAVFGRRLSIAICPRHRFPTLPGFSLPGPGTPSSLGIGCQPRRATPYPAHSRPPPPPAATATVGPSGCIPSPVVIDLENRTC